jgi:exodeoxyribonuclease-5
MNVMAPVLADEQARLTALTAHARSLLVEAGAGSGKTAVMAGRVALMLAAGITPKNVAAVTFTELAASELLARVQDFVDELLAGRTPRELSSALPHGLSDDQRAALTSACENLDEITCSTIHGFCQRLIKPYPVEANIDPGASLVDPVEADLAFGDALDRWLRETLDGSQPGLVSELVYHEPVGGLELIRGVADKLRRHRVLAGPAAPALAPALAAFRDTAGSYRDFVTAAPAREEESIAAADAFAGMAGRLEEAGDGQDARSLVALLTIEPDASLLTATGWRKYQKKGKWEAALKLQGLPKAGGGELNAEAEQLHNDARDAWIDFKGAVAARVLSDLLVGVAPVVDGFRAYKRAAALLDFDDLIFAARDLLRDHEPVRQALGRRYAHVLVDEFQDTDPLQSEIFWRLCGDPADGSDTAGWHDYRLRPGALFLVGDPKQAIYRFRGADVAAYVRARDAIRGQGNQDLLSISTNFRSCSGILSFVNTRFEPHLGEDKGQPGFTPLDPFHPDPAHGLCVTALPVACAGADGKASADRKRDCEADAVADLIARLVGSHEIADRRSGVQRPCRPGDIALLAPTGKDLWRYEQALEQRGIAVATQAGKGFYQRQEVQDLVAITRVLADERDTLALGALMRGPLVGLTEEELLDLVWAQPRDAERPDALPRLTINMDLEAVTHPVAREVLTRLQGLRRRINAATPHQLLAEAVDALNVRAVLLQRHRGQAERPLANVDLFLSLARPYGVRGLRAFAQAMTDAWAGEARSAEGRPDAQEESVSLLTVHASKGLEWPIVVPINCMTATNAADTTVVDRAAGVLFMPVFGHRPSGHADAHEAEKAEQERERTRLWYVAATRARELLVLPRPDVAPASNSWSGLLDLQLDELQVLDLAAYPDQAAPADDGNANEQTRERFADEAAAIVGATARIVWAAPSRDEAVAGLPTEGDAAELVFGEEVAAPQAGPVQGGRERGLVIHKLFEEVLTGEVAADEATLAARALELIRQLGLEPSADAAIGLSPDEVARVVLRTLALPEIAAVHDRLVPELSVLASDHAEGIEVATAGIVDALCLGSSGKPELVIDWKSDVDPDPAVAEQYQGQIRRYLEVTGTPAGMVVFVTSGTIVHVSQ